MKRARKSNVEVIKENSDGEIYIFFDKIDQNEEITYSLKTGTTKRKRTGKYHGHEETKRNNRP